MTSSRRVPSLMFILPFLALAVLADTDPQPPGKQKLELAGQLVCVGCHLQKEYGAQAQCTLHAKHAQGLLADDGRMFTILDNGRGHLLITDRKLAGSQLRLEAQVFPKAQIVEALRFSKREGQAWVAYDYCKNCGFEPGDNQGKDLCGDCAE